MITGRAAVGCDRCPAVHLVVEGRAPETCPACGEGSLAPTEHRVEGEPEWVIPRAVDRGRAAEVLATFVSPTPFATAELDPTLLAARLAPVWLPWWLVDAAVGGAWEAEAGFDYDVQSSVEVFDAGSWHTRQVTETRVRWEARVGRVRRSYDNVAVPGLLDQSHIEGRIGAPDLSGARADDGEGLGDGMVRLPDRSTAEGWPDAQAQLRALVADDCRRACAADHVRDVYVDLDADQAAWTWMLVPVWTSWYSDDEGQRHVLWVDGTTGRAGGPRRASSALGVRWAVGLGSSAAVLALVGVGIGLVGVVVWPLLVLAGVLLVLALLLGCAAIWPLVRPRQWNQQSANA